MFPVEKDLGPKTKGRYGYKDGHVEIGVKIPVYGFTWLRIDASEIEIASKFLTEARMFSDMPKEDRERIGAD